MKIKRFKTLTKITVKRLSQIMRLRQKESLFSSRKNEIKSSLSESESVGAQVLKLIEFYDLDGFDLNHWIEGLADRLEVKKQNEFTTPLSLASFSKDINSLNIEDEDIKEIIFNKKRHGSDLLDYVWNSNKFKTKYKNFLKINGNKRLYDDKFYLNLFCLLCDVINDPNELSKIDSNTIYKLKYHGITIKKSGKSLDDKELKQLLKEFIIRIKGYEK